jgi:hypothetical protein
MTRRATRSPGLRARRPGTSARPTDPLHALQTLDASRGTARAERALEVWERAAAEQTDVFSASTDALVKRTVGSFTDNERRLLLGVLASLAADPQLLEILDTLDERLALEARTWPMSDDDEIDEEALREASPVYRALSDAYEVMRTAQEVLFLREIGCAELARELSEDAQAWDRACADGEATLLGRPRIVTSPDDDPFGILRA